MTRDRHAVTSNPPSSSKPSSGFGQIAFYFFLIALLAIPLLQSLFTTQLTCGFDTVFHLWRSVQAGALLDGGVLFSRWAPQMAHGYGYPLFLFQ